MQEEKMTYVFKEGEEDKAANERTIEQRGYVSEFSFVQVQNNILTFKKTLKELNANLQNQKLVMDNVENHHPFVKEMPEVDRIAVHMYQGAHALAKQYTDKIAEIQSEFDILLADIEAIKEALPELADIPNEEETA